MSVSSHLRDAIESLEAARDEAGLGTSLMIDTQIKEVRDLLNRVTNINDDNSDDA